MNTFQRFRVFLEPVLCNLFFFLNSLGFKKCSLWVIQMAKIYSHVIRSLLLFCCCFCPTLKGATAESHWVPEPQVETMQPLCLSFSAVKSKILGS